MGASYDKGKKRWVVRIRRKDSGEIVRTLKSGVTKHQAEEEYRRIERELIDKKHGKQRVLISDVWKRIIEEELPKHKRPENTRKLIQRDLEEEFVRDDEARERSATEVFKPLGMDCDRKQWERVRELWKGRN